MHWEAKCASGESKAAGAGINDARGIRDPARQWGSATVGRRGRPHRHVPMRLYSWAHRRGADGAYIKARKVACWAWGGYTPHRASQPLVRFIWEDVGTGHKTADNKREAHPTPNTQHSIFNTQHSILNTQYATLNTQHLSLNTQHSIFNTQFPTLNTQHSTLNI